MSQAKKEVYQILFDDEYTGIVTKLEPGAIPLLLNSDFVSEFRENNFGESPCFQLANDFLAFSYRGIAPRPLRGPLINKIKDKKKKSSSS